MSKYCESLTDWSIPLTDRVQYVICWLRGVSVVEYCMLYVNCVVFQSWSIVCYMLVAWCFSRGVLYVVCWLRGVSVVEYCMLYVGCVVFQSWSIVCCMLVAWCFSRGVLYVVCWLRGLSVMEYCMLYVGCVVFQSWSIICYMLVVWSFSRVCSILVAWSFSRGVVMGIWNSHTSVGNILGSLISGAFVNDNWGLSFIVPGAIIAAMGVLTFIFLVPRK